MLFIEQTDRISCFFLLGGIYPFDTYNSLMSMIEQKQQQNFGI